MIPPWYKCKYGVEVTPLWFTKVELKRVEPNLGNVHSWAVGHFLTLRSVVSQETSLMGGRSFILIGKTL